MADISVIESHSDAVILKRKCIIEDVYHHSIRKLVANPILVNFRTPCPKDGTLRARLEREPVQDGEHSKRKYRNSVCITGGDRVFEGHYLTPAKASTEDVVMLGLLNRTTGKMKLVEMEKFTVSAIKSSNSTLFEGEEEGLDVNVNVMFGTKKNLQRYNEMIEQKARQSQQVLDSIEGASKQVASEGLDDASTTDYSYIVPSINEEATRPSDVYDLSSIVDDSVLEWLIDEATTLLDTKLTACQQVSPLFLVTLASAKLEAEQDIKLRNACATIYMEYLCNLASGVQIDESKIEDTVVGQLEKTYGKHIQIKKSKQDLALAHLMVLAMILNRFKLPISILHQSVSVPKSKLMIFSKVLRFRMQTADFVLKLPLPAAGTQSTKRFAFNKRSKRSAY